MSAPELRYKVLRTIGGGSGGDVSLVVDRQTNASYVMKKLPLLGGDAEAQQRAEHEVNVLKRIDHPNIVKYKTSFATKHHMNLVMEKCEMNLDEVIEHCLEHDCVIQPPVVIEWMTELLCGLHHIHKQNIIHRDIKSSNIFVSKRNHMKIGDFGVCRQLGQGELVARTFVGTPHYIAPEVLSDEPYNASSDIWALGVVFYELCALTKPFNGANILSLTTSITNGEFDPLPAYLDPRFTKIVTSMLQVDPAKRPTAQQLVSSHLLLSTSHPSHPSHAAAAARTIQRDSGPSEIYVSRAAVKPREKRVVAEAAAKNVPSPKASPNKFARRGAKPAASSAVVAAAAAASAAAAAEIPEEAADDVTPADAPASGANSAANTMVSTASSTASADAAPPVSVPVRKAVADKDHGTFKRSRPSSSAGSFPSPGSAPPSSGRAAAAPVVAQPQRAAAAPSSPGPASQRMATGGTSPAPRPSPSRMTSQDHQQSLSRIKNAKSRINMNELRQAMKSRSPQREEDTSVYLPSGPVSLSHHDPEALPENFSPERRREVPHPMREAAPATPPRAQRDIVGDVRAVLEQYRGRVSLSDIDDMAELLNAYKVEHFGLV